MSGTTMGNKLGVGGGGQPSMPQPAHTDPLASITGSSMQQGIGKIMGMQQPQNGDITGATQAQGIDGILKQFGQRPPGAPRPMGQMAQQGAMGGLTAGLGAGDAAASAVDATAIPGGDSAALLGHMMQGIGDQNRAAIQKRIDLAKQLMGGG